MKVESSRFIRSAFSRGDFLDDHHPEFAFAGRSNVGKSSLLNRLLGRKGLAKISSTPGRTRAINYFLINSRFYFVDLPGYGYAKVSKEERRGWGELMQGYFRHAGSRSHVLLLVDAKVGATPLDVQAFDFLGSVGRLPTVVATKADRVSRGRRKAALDAIRQNLALDERLKIIPFSARSGEGVKELWSEIDEKLRSSESITKGKR